MPAALDIPWEAVRTLAVAVGIREAARQIGVSEDAVRQRSCREGWLRDLPRSTPLPPTVVQRVTGVTEPAIAMGQTLSEMGNRTRLNLARGLSKGADTVADMDGQEVLMSAGQVSQLVKSAQIVHGWQSNVAVNVLSDVLADPDQDISGQVIDI